MNILRTCFLLSHIEEPIKQCNEGKCVTGISDCSINRHCGLLLANGSFTNGLIQTSDNKVTVLALGNLTNLPLTITLVGHGGQGQGGGAGSGYIKQYNLNLYESLTELRVEVPEVPVPPSYNSKSTKVSLAEADILLDQAEAGGNGYIDGGNGYSGGGCRGYYGYGGSDGGSGLCGNDNSEPGQGSGLNISELRFHNFELR